jgi:tight adherence protein B
MGLGPDQLLVIVGAVVIALVIVFIGVISARSERDLVEDRLANYVGDVYEPIVAEVEEERPKDGGVLLRGVDNMLSERRFGKKWRLQLSRADLRLTVAEFAALHIISMAGFFMIGYFLLFAGDMVFSIIAGFIGFFAPRIFVARKISKRLIAFETQLPDTLGLWVNALRSGYSVMQAMEAISRDAPEPTKAEFKRVVQEIQLGIDMSDAMEHMLSRVESDDLDLVVTAVNIQREVGGNLSEILEVIAGTIRERIKLKGEIRVLTSQGRITGILISFLPIALALFLNVINPGYMGEMFNNRLCGWPMIGVGLALIGIGTAVIQKIVDIEI